MGAKQEIFCGRSTDIFWNCTIKIQVVVISIILIHWVIPEKKHLPPPPPQTTDGTLEILAGGGSKALEILAGGGVWT